MLGLCEPELDQNLFSGHNLAFVGEGGSGDVFVDHAITPIEMASLSYYGQYDSQPAIPHIESDGPDNVVIVADLGRSLSVVGSFDISPGTLKNVSIQIKQGNIALSFGFIMDGNEGSSSFGGEDKSGSANWFFDNERNRVVFAINFKIDI